MPKASTTVQIRPDSSTPGILGSHAHMLERMKAVPPRALDPRFLASPEELQDRADTLNIYFRAFEDFVLKFLADSADHTWAVNFDRTCIGHIFHDLRSEAVGTLSVAAETARQENEWAA